MSIVPRIAGGLGLSPNPGDYAPLLLVLCIGAFVLVAYFSFSRRT